MPANIAGPNSPPTNPSNGPPPPNPILTAYESYLQSTPLITRYILNSILASYFLSFLVNPAYALANIPLFTLFRFELYRIFTSPLVCTDILNVFFAFLGFTNHGIRLENSMGSSLFGVLFFTLTVVNNLLFLLLSLILYGLTNEENYLATPSLGIWTVLLSIIAVECAQSPNNTQTSRKLFFLTVPTIYYPLAILALFSLFAGPKLSYCIGVGVGYAYGYGKMDRWKVKVERVRKWEDGGCLRGFVGRVGWVSLGSASGALAWSEGDGGSGGSGGGGGGGSSGGGGWGGLGGRGSIGGGEGGGGPGAYRSPSDPASSSSAPSFPTTGGRSLGSSSGSGGILSRARGKNASQPKSHEERAALLERAAERRRQQQQQQSEEGDGGEMA